MSSVTVQNSVIDAVESFDSLETRASTWLCVKRNGEQVPFDVSRIRRALHRCFYAIKMTDESIDRTLPAVVRGTLRAIASSGLEKIQVEEVQRLIIAQLWGLGLFDAAEHYQNYREAQRKKRIAAPVSEETHKRFEDMQKHFSNDLSVFVMLTKLSRWIDEENRRETWREVVDRTMNWFKKIVRSKGHYLYDEEWDMLDKSLYSLKASPALRVLQMAGPAVDRCHVGVYNCAYQPIDDLFSLPELLYTLMAGSGVGFSVESEYVNELPRVKGLRTGASRPKIVVEDSTEGWCDAYFEGLQLLFDGYEPEYDVHKVRKKNSRLKTKGGFASGPGPFLELTRFAQNVISARRGQYLQDTDVHRLACFTGRIVQVGGVRRAATLSLSDLYSIGMRDIKSGSWYADTTYWPDGRYLTMANNSAAYYFEDRKPPIGDFMTEWTALVKSESGERGIFNRMAAIKKRPERRLPARFGCNPCGEIILRPRQFCNLSIAIGRHDDTIESLEAKVIVATYFGVIQSLCTDFKYIRPEWKKNCEEERLLGVDITGHADCALLQHTNKDLPQLLQRMNAKVAEVAKKLSARFGINYSAANTTVKPAGDSALLFDCGSGISARFAKQQIRWVREAVGSPIANFLIDSGVPHAPAPESPDQLLVFGFPRKAPEGCLLRDDMTAAEQFKNWLVWKRNYAEHSVSATIYVEPHEWLELGHLVYENFEDITGLSFLPKDNGRYTYAPNEELTEEQFEKFSRDFPKINWAKLTHYERYDSTTGSQTFACTGDKCEA